jgi:hypothetical protein
MRLFYSGYKQYAQCPFEYWNGAVGKTIVDKVDDRLGSVFGTVFGRLVETFYKQALWKNPAKAREELQAKIETYVDYTLKRETTAYGDKPAGVLLWKEQNPKALYANRAELISDIRTHIPNALEIIKHHRLLGPLAEAEFTLDFETPDQHVLGGRADFLIQRLAPHSDLVILDGKGSRHRDAYVDPDQLKWYATLYWLNSFKENPEGKLPDRLGYVYWRSPPEKAVDWLTFTELELAAFYENALDVLKEIEGKAKKTPERTSPNAARGVFLAKPSEKNCTYCKYTEVCPPGRSRLDKRE